MTLPEETPTTDVRPIPWESGARAQWQKVERSRNRKNLYLLAAAGPYLLSGAMLGLAAASHGRDVGVWIALGGGLFLIFFLVSPYWLYITLREWWRWRRTFREERKAFRRWYGVDPCLLVPPDEKPL